MAIGIQSQGTDLDSIFDTYKFGDRAANTGIQYGGVDITSRYQAAAAGSSTAAGSVGIQHGGSDIGPLFAKYGSTVTSSTTSVTTSFVTTWSTSFITTYNSSHTTSQTTSQSTTWTTSFTTQVANCLLEGSCLQRADGTHVPVETLQCGDRLASMDLPGLYPETIADYDDFRNDDLRGWEAVETTILAIETMIVEWIYDITVAPGVSDQAAIEAHVTPEHPFLVWTVDGTYRFLTACELSLDDCIVGSDGTSRAIVSIASRQGAFRIFKIDCSPYDLFIHDDLVGHNMKIGGDTYTYVTTSETTTATTSFTTSYTVTSSVSRTTSQTTSQTTSRITTYTTSA